MLLLPLVAADDVYSFVCWLETSTQWDFVAATDGTSLLTIPPTGSPYDGFAPPGATGGGAGPGYLDNVGAFCVLAERNGLRRLLIQRGLGEAQSWSAWLAENVFVLDAAFPVTRRPVAVGEVCVLVSGDVLASAVAGKVRVDHNYGGVAALRYQAPNGVPIEGATIRAYLKSDYARGLTDVAKGITQTNARGEWVDPIMLTTGETYVIYFNKDGLYGPNTVEITV